MRVSSLANWAACAVAVGVLGLAHAKDKHDDHDHDHDQAGAHVHGVAYMDIAIDDDKELVADIRFSAHDVVGFEHAPTTQEEKSKLVQAKQALLQPPLAPNAEAACTLKKAEVDFDAEGHDHDHGDKKDDKHDKDGKHDKHDDDHGHSDVEVEYTFVCDKPEALQSFQVDVAKRFASVHTIEVQMALPAGQFSRTLKQGQTALTWK